LFCIHLPPAKLPNIEDEAKRADYEGKAQTLHRLNMVFDVFSFAVSLHHRAMEQRVVLLGKQSKANQGRSDRKQTRGKKREIKGIHFFVVTSIFKFPK